MRYCFQCEYNSITSFDTHHLIGLDQTVICTKGVKNKNNLSYAQSCKSFKLKEFAVNVCAMCKHFAVDEEFCNFEGIDYFQDSSVPFGSHEVTTYKWATKCKGFVLNELYFVAQESQKEKEEQYVIKKLESMSPESVETYLGNEVFRARIPEKGLIRFHIDKSFIRPRDKYVAVDVNLKFLLEIINNLVTK